MAGNPAYKAMVHYNDERGWIQGGIFTQGWELVSVAVALSMDAFAVSICKGLALPRLKAWHAVVVGLYFGAFQAGMPLLGYLLGTRFSGRLQAIDHWAAFVLLAGIGVKMIWDARQPAAGDDEKMDASLRVGGMLVLAVATSVDALAVGLTYAFLKVSIVGAVAAIGCVTFALSGMGVWVGHVFGARFEGKAELLGGAALILIGGKILLEHLGVF